MALQQACYVENGKTVGGVVPDASSAIGYKENVGGTCVNPNGYTAGSCFMASNNGYMYKALTNIARGDAFQIGTNCEQTNVSSELNTLNNNLTELSTKAERGDFAMPLYDFANPLYTFSTPNSQYIATRECYLVGDTRPTNSGNAEGTVSLNGQAYANGFLNQSIGNWDFIEVKLAPNDVVDVTGAAAFGHLHILVTR